MHIGELVIAYGQTETSPVVTMSDAADSIEVRVNTVGRAMPQTEIQVISPETGQLLPRGQQGEICARGFVVMKAMMAIRRAPRRWSSPTAGCTRAIWA